MATETATLGGGCFWCLEAVFEQLQGVHSVVSGYAGGKRKNPTYEQVCSGATGHAEVVQITYDPLVLDYRDLLRVFFTIHDPTTKDRQGADVGSQYRSIIFYHTPKQHSDAQAVITELGAAGLWDAPVVTELEPYTEFWPAEQYHQGYFRGNPEQPYCAFTVAPKVAKFRKAFFNRLKAS